MSIWHGERDGEAGGGKGNAEGQPHEHGERRGGRRSERDAAVVEDERLRVLVSRELGALSALSAHHINFLQETKSQPAGQ